jgi:hypothetical protein
MNPTTQMNTISDLLIATRQLITFLNCFSKLFILSEIVFWKSVLPCICEHKIYF